MQMGFEEEGVGARAPDREIGLGFGGGYGKITGSTSHPRIHVKQILAEMESEGSDRFVFGCEVREVTLKDIFSNDYTRNAHVPYIINGTVPVFDLEDVGTGISVTISIPYEKTDDDFDFLLKTWSVDSDGELDDVDSTYEGGYMTFTTDEMDEIYVITSNPLGDFSIVWVGVAGIAAILVLLIIVTLIVRFIVRR